MLSDQISKKISDKLNESIFDKVEELYHMSTSGLWHTRAKVFGERCNHEDRDSPTSRVHVNECLHHENRIHHILKAVHGDDHADASEQYSVIVNSPNSLGTHDPEAKDLWKKHVKGKEHISAASHFKGAGAKAASVGGAVLKGIGKAAMWALFGGTSSKKVGADIKNASNQVAQEIGWTPKR